MNFIEYTLKTYQYDIENQSKYRKSFLGRIGNAFSKKSFSLFFILGLLISFILFMFFFSPALPLVYLSMLIMPFVLIKHDNSYTTDGEKTEVLKIIYKHLEQNKKIDKKTHNDLVQLANLIDEPLSFSFWKKVVSHLNEHHIEFENKEKEKEISKYDVLDKIKIIHTQNKPIKNKKIDEYIDDENSDNMEHITIKQKAMMDKF